MAVSDTEDADDEEEEEEEEDGDIAEIMAELHDSEAAAKEEDALVDIDLDVNDAESQLEGSEAEEELEETYIGFKEGVFDEGYSVFSDEAPAFNRMFLKSMIAINLDDIGWCVGRVLRKFKGRDTSAGTWYVVSFESEEQQNLLLNPEFYWVPPDESDHDDGDVGTPGLWCVVEPGITDDDAAA